MLRFVSPALALLLCACASKTVWMHQSKGQQDFYRENSECLAMAGAGQAPQMMPGTNPVAAGFNQGAAMRAQANQREIYEQCMMGRGWMAQR